MKKTNKSLPLYIALGTLLCTSVYFFSKVNALETTLENTDLQKQELAKTVATSDALLQIDSLLLKDDYSAALSAYEAQKDEVGTFEDSRVALRIAVANKLVALQGNRLDSAKTELTIEEIDSVSILKSTTNRGIKQLDSMAFVLQKTKVQLARLKQSYAAKTAGKYLTFKSSKGTDIHFVGTVNNGMANGSGLALLSTGSRYEGQWRNNERHGEGTFYWPDGEYYVGTYSQDQRNGLGTYHWPNGERYVGQWKNDQRMGEGVFYSKDGKVIKGIWKKDKLVEEFKKDKPKKSLATNNRR